MPVFVYKGQSRFGWKIDGGSATANGNGAENLTEVAPEDQYKTFNHLMDAANDYVWEFAVDNGEYFVRVVAGDPGVDNGCIYVMNLEEGTANKVEIVNGEPSPENPWVVGVGTVTVADGKLTISNGTPPVGGDMCHNPICFVEFIPQSELNGSSGATGIPLGHDNLGHIINDGHFSYTWDIFGRMTSATDTAWEYGDPRPEKVYYLYDALGRRVVRRCNVRLDVDPWKDVRIIHDGVMPIAEHWLHNSGQVLERYYYEGLARPYMVDNGWVGIAGRGLLLTDDRGSVAGVIDWYLPGPGWEQLYYNTTGLCRSFKGAFLGGGENLRTDDPDYNLGRSYWTPFGYLGMRRDRFTGLYHTHFREYDAVHGRWLSEDPAGYADGLNLYQAYMGVNGTDPLGLRITREELLSAYLKLFGDNPVYRSFFATGGKLEVGDYLRNRSISYSRDNTYTISIEEDIDLATAALHLHGAMNDVLAQSYSMKDEYLGYFEYDPIALGQAYEAVNRAAFSIGAQKVSTLADMYVSAFGIFNEGLDMALSIGEIANGNNMAWLGVLPFAPSVVGKVLRQTDNVWDASKIAFRKTSTGRKILSYSDNAARYMNNGWSWFHYQIHEHHIWFRCLGGSDEASNMLSMQMMIHGGRGVGLHQHILREMGYTTYKGLSEGWEVAIGKGGDYAKEFIDNVRHAYSSYFMSSPDYEEIMKVINNALDQVKY